MPPSLQWEELAGSTLPSTSMDGARFRKMAGLVPQSANAFLKKKNEKAEKMSIVERRYLQIRLWNALSPELQLRYFDS